MAKEIPANHREPTPPPLAALDATARAHPTGLDSLDLKQIRCFVAAYEEGSFSKAAQREHCTQPGLSVYIQRLEATLGHRLFDRKARGVTPTIAGRHFYGCCSEVLRTVGLVKNKCSTCREAWPVK